MFASLNNIPAPDPATLLVPEQLASIPLLETAAEVYPLIADVIVPDEPGVYVLNGPLTPLVTPRDYLRLKDGTQVQFDDLGKLNEDIYCGGRLAIPKSLMANKVHKLSLQPQISRVTIGILKAYLDYRVCSATHWASNHHARKMFDRLFKDGEASSEAEDTIKRQTSHLTKVVTDFVYENSWAIYDTFMMGSTYNVARCLDWRAYQWSIQEHDKQHPELYQ